MPAKYFSEEELICKCGCGETITDQDFLDMLDLLREAMNVPLILSSGKRCSKHNKEVSNTGDNGPHTICAVDIKCHGRLAQDIVFEAIRLGFTGIGVNQKGPYESRFIHIDRLPSRGYTNRPWIWSY